MIQLEALNFRTANPDDVSGITAMHAQSWLDTYPNEEHGIGIDWVQQQVQDLMFSDIGMEYRLQRIESAREHPHQAFYEVVEHQALGIMGLAVATKTPEAQTLVNFYLKVRLHGSGVADVLMRRFLNWTDLYRPVDLEVALYNRRAQSFYDRWMFAEVPGSQHECIERIPAINMRREASI